MNFFIHFLTRQKSCLNPLHWLICFFAFPAMQELVFGKILNSKYLFPFCLNVRLVYAYQKFKIGCNYLIYRDLQRFKMQKNEFLHSKKRVLA